MDMCIFLSKFKR